MAESRVRQAGVELLRELHLQLSNHWGAPLVGWKPTSQGVGGMHNPKGWASIRFVLWKMIQGVRALMYDQPMIVEDPGSIVLLVDDQDRVGLIQSFRMVGPRLRNEDGHTRRIEEVDREGRWPELAEGLGKWMWEAPRGLAHGDETKAELEAMALTVARREAGEEAGATLKSARLVGLTVANPGFFTHGQPTVIAEVAITGKAHADDLEIIGNLHFFTSEELRGLIKAGELEDGLTLAPIGMWLLGA